MRVNEVTKSYARELDSMFGWSASHLSRLEEFQRALEAAESDELDRLMTRIADAISGGDKLDYYAVIGVLSSMRDNFYRYILQKKR